MAGPFRTIGSILSTVDVVANSTARRLNVWAQEQEAKTKYRSLAGTMRIKREAAEDLTNELVALNDANQSQAFQQAWEMLSALDSQKQD